MYSPSPRTTRATDRSAFVPPIDRDFWSQRAQVLWSHAEEWDEVVTGLWSQRDAVTFALAHEMKEVVCPDAPLSVVDLLVIAEKLVSAL